MAAIRQTNFSGGELAPQLHGRTDLAKFGTGLRTCKNFFVSKHGAAVSRPGTKFIANPVKHTGGFGLLSAPPRLVPFVVSDTESYVLEVNHSTIRFYRDGARLETSPGVPYEIASPWFSSAIQQLRWAQTGDVLTLVGPGSPPMELRRVATLDWTLTEVTYQPVASFFRDVDVPSVYTLSPQIVAAGADPYPLHAEDATHFKREWKFLVTALIQEVATGAVYETLPFTVAHKYQGLDPAVPGDQLPLENSVVLYPDKPLTIRRSASTGFLAGPTYASLYRTLAYNHYRGRADLFGFVGQTKTREFVDFGAEPNYAIQPPLGTHPFQVFDSLNNLSRTEVPIAVTYFQERLVFGGTYYRPGTLFFSAVGDYRNFDRRLLIHVADESLEIELASRRREEVRHLLSLFRLLVFTDSSVWSVGGTQGSPLSFDSVDARVVDEVGCSFYVPPLVVDGTALYVRAKGTGVRGVFPSGNTEAGMEAIDLSVISQHLFTGASATLVDWCYAEDPWGLVWAVRSDGALLSLTFSKGEGTWAWARHELPGARVCQVCCVPEGDEDAVYLVVERTINEGLPGEALAFSVERMTSRVRLGGTDDDICLDYVFSQTVAQGATTVTGLDGLVGKTVWVVSQNNTPYGPYQVDASATVELPEALYANNGAGGTIVHVGLAYTCDLETLDIASTDARTKQKTVTKVAFEVFEAQGIKVGPDFNHLAEWRQREAGASYGPLSPVTTLAEVPVRDAWNKTGRAVLRQSQPLPVTVVGLTREVDIGG